MISLARRLVIFYVEYNEVRNGENNRHRIRLDILCFSSSRSQHEAHSGGDYSDTALSSPLFRLPFGGNFSTTFDYLTFTSRIYSCLLSDKRLFSGFNSGNCFYSDNLAFALSFNLYYYGDGAKCLSLLRNSAESVRPARPEMYGSGRRLAGSGDSKTEMPEPVLQQATRRAPRFSGTLQALSG